MNNYVKPLENETFEEYKIRVYKMKQLGTCNLTWVTIAQMFGETFGVFKDESRWRKEAKEFLMRDVEFATADEDESIEVDTQEDKMTKLLLEYKKERVKLSDERIQNNAYVRRLSREETIKEIAFQTAREMSSKKIFNTNIPPVTNSTSDEPCEGILQLSDWHYGINIDTFWNKFNPEICKHRVNNLLIETLNFCATFGVSRLHIVNLSDLICGRIHQTLRLQSRIDTITQIMEVAEMLAEFITTITSNGILVEYYDCLDNHSRLEPNKSDSLDLESLVRIIPWYLRERLKDNYNVNINDNQYDEDIIDFEVLGYKVCGVHGHKDRPGKVVEGLTLMTKEHFDLILTAHLHHFNTDEKNEVVVVSNGSLMGTDSYAKDLRLSSIPSQNLILVSNKSVIDYIHRVIVI
jgi:hypothetical protein